MGRACIGVFIVGKSVRWRVAGHFRYNHDSGME